MKFMDMAHLPEDITDKVLNEIESKIIVEKLGGIAAINDGEVLPATPKIRDELVYEEVVEVCGSGFIEALIQALAENYGQQNK